MNKRKHTVIDKSHRGGERLRPKTSRKHPLKAVHILLWQWLWERQRLLSGEPYVESQLAAAKHFGVDHSTVSRQLGVLIENEAVIVLKDRERGADGFWTSKVVHITEPPANPFAKMHLGQAVENTEASSTCKFATPNAVHSTVVAIQSNPSTDSNSSTTADGDCVSGAKMQVGEGVENKASCPHAKMHTERVSLADQLVAAKSYLEELERHVAERGVSGWEETLRRQRAKVRELELEYTGHNDDTGERGHVSQAVCTTAHPEESP